MTWGGKVDRASLLEVLTAVREGRRSVDEAVAGIEARRGAERLSYATVDIERAARTGVPEVVYGAGKSAEQIIGIFRALHRAGQDAIATRTDANKAEIVVSAFERITWHREAEILVSRV